MQEIVRPTLMKTVLSKGYGRELNWDPRVRELRHIKSPIKPFRAQLKAGLMTTLRYSMSHRTEEPLLTPKVAESFGFS